MFLLSSTWLLASMCLTYPAALTLSLESVIIICLHLFLESLESWHCKVFFLFNFSRSNRYLIVLTCNFLIVHMMLSIFYMLISHSCVFMFRFFALQTGHYLEL